MKDRFYLACFRDNVGGNVAWHGDGCGYTTDVRKAEIFSREEAQKQWNGLRSFDRPISADHVDSALIWKVDHQYVPTETPAAHRDNEPLVAFVPRQWSGNDLYWLSDNSRTLDIHKATPFSLRQAGEKRLAERYVLIPQSLALEVARPTFDMENYNPRTMVQGAGIRIPSHIRRERKRRPSSKVLMNCPDCGRFNWQMNPHDFETCNNMQCRSNNRW